MATGDATAGDDTQRRRATAIALIAILVLAAALRLYDLGHNPPSLFEDELAGAISAWTVATTGHDVAATNLPFLTTRLELKMPLYGYALQCRVTTEDPQNNFVPDYGKIHTYRSPAGFGIRLDGGSAYGGAVISPYYDSLLVKLTAWGQEFSHACRRMDRALREFRIRGVKTNIPFLENVVNSPVFQSGGATTSFIDETPSLFAFAPRQDRATRLLTYIADVTVNGNPEVKGKPVPERLRPAPG